jgi:hypothetical protein
MPSVVRIIAKLEAAGLRPSYGDVYELERPWPTGRHLIGPGVKVFGGGPKPSGGGGTGGSDCWRF